MSFILLGILNSQAAAGGVPAPAFLSSAPLWLDAADASTISESGGSVSQWDNKGTLENFTQATSADQPTTGVNTLNGLNVIDFATDFLTGATKAQWKFLHDGTKYFTASVVRFGNVANPDALFGLWGTNAAGSNIGASVSYDDRNSASSNNRYITNIYNGSDNNILILDPDFFTPNAFSVYSDIRDPLNATAGDRISYFLNETEGSVANTQTTGVTSADPFENMAIGNVSGASATGLLTGAIAEIIIVSGADATESNRQEVVDYLNAKWAVF